MAREGIFIRVERRLDAGWGVGGEKKFISESLEAHFFSIYCFFHGRPGSPLEKYFTLQ